MKGRVSVWKYCRLPVVFAIVATVYLGREAVKHQEGTRNWILGAQSFSNEKVRGLVHYGVDPANGCVAFIIVIPSAVVGGAGMQYSQVGTSTWRNGGISQSGSLFAKGKTYSYPNEVAPNLVVARTNGTIELYRFEPAIDLDRLVEYITSEKDEISAERIVSSLGLSAKKRSSFEEAP